MVSSLYFGHAPTAVIEKFNQFFSIYSSLTAALDALLERDQLLTKKYRFIQAEKCEEFDIAGTLADTDVALEEITGKLDSYVQHSKLASRAAAVEELLLSPDLDNNHQNGDTSGDDCAQTDLPQNVMNSELDLQLHPILSEELLDEAKRVPQERKKKRKSRKPKKHKRKRYDDESCEEEEARKKRPRDVWRRVGSKFIGWYTCVLCDKQLVNQEEYLQHITDHGDAHSPACMDCGNYFESMVAYEDHIANLGKDLLFRCDVDSCGKSFQFKCRLECHKRSHSGDLMYECNDCGHKLSSIRSIIRHTRAKHLNERPYRCNLCNKAFAIQSQLTRHIKDHLSPPHFTCEKCGRVFSSRQGYHYHQLDHLGIKPHKCSVCGKAFRNKTDMVNHERIHSGDRPFTCELCGKSFVEKGALRKHRVVHTREKNYVCSNCGKQFGYKCSLDGHLRKCQQDVSLLPLPTITGQGVEPVDLSGNNPGSGPTDLSQGTSSHDARDRMNMYPCSMSNYGGVQHGMIPKSTNDHAMDAMQPHMSKPGARMVKKTAPYRQGMSNHHQDVSKQNFHEKQIPEPQMYPTFQFPVNHQQRENTIDADILASVLGQKMPLQSHMEQIQYNERMPRDDGHQNHYRPLGQQDRDPSGHILDGALPAPSTVPGYDQHRHSHQPQTSDSMIFQLQTGRQHYRH